MAGFDTHLHLFHSEAAGLQAQGGVPAAGIVGVIDDVRALLARGRIDRVLAITTPAAELVRRAALRSWPTDLHDDERRRRRAELEERLLAQIRRQNSWICDVAAAEPRVGAVVAADPTVDAARTVADLVDLLARDEVRAVKIHPAMSYVHPDHPGYLGVYGAARDAGTPVISHGGSSAGTFYAAEIDYCAPANFAPVLERFPGLTLVVAHLGHPWHDELVAVAERHPGVCTDLSFVLGAGLLPPAQLASTIRAFGVERVLFASDFPFFAPEDSLERLEAAGLTPGELEMVRAGNAERIFTRTESE